MDSTLKGIEKNLMKNSYRPASSLAALILLLCTVLLPISTQAAGTTRWTEQQANTWSAKQPWLVGSDYIPDDAINQLEMWQADTFDPVEIDRELGWAQGLGMNTMRVFLHDLLWQQDAAGFQKRIEAFLAIADKHHIRPVLVLFDSCWDPRPKLGPQHPPIPGVHNSGWVQSPGTAALENSREYARLQQYVQGIVGAFAKDPRILAWDLWNEPDNEGGGGYAAEEPPNKTALVATLLPQVFTWARAAQPTQPLTSGVWTGDWTSSSTLSQVARIQIEQSDIVSFHNYGWPEEFEQRVHALQQYHRPLLCTEYMARGAGSTFDTILPIAKREHVGVINWGFVAGKTQTWLPWDSWKRPYVTMEPTVWFHDIFHEDGTLYRAKEGELFRSMTGVKATQ